MSAVAACENCGAIADVRCVDDHCCNRDDRDAAFLNTVGQSWQSEANRLLDKMVDAVVEKRRLNKIAAEHRDKVDAAGVALLQAEAAFDKFIGGCVKLRSDVALDG